LRRYRIVTLVKDGERPVLRANFGREHRDDLDEVEAARSKALRHRRGEYGLEYRFILPSSEVRWIEARSFVSCRSDGRSERLVGVNIDGSERKLEQEHQRVLHTELDHRVKNVLAIVSTVAGTRTCNSPRYAVKM